jgi:hypothetical protein
MPPRRLRFACNLGPDIADDRAKPDAQNTLDTEMTSHF